MGERKLQVIENDIFYLSAKFLINKFAFNLWK